MKHSGLLPALCLHRETHPSSPWLIFMHTFFIESLTSSHLSTFHRFNEPSRKYVLKHIDRSHRLDGYIPRSATPFSYAKECCKLSQPINAHHIGPHPHPLLPSLMSTCKPSIPWIPALSTAHLEIPGFMVMLLMLHGSPPHLSAQAGNTTRSISTVFCYRVHHLTRRAYVKCKTCMKYFRFSEVSQQHHHRTLIGSEMQLTH